MTTIYYLCPDFETPSGGTREIYWHVWQLRQGGYDAKVVHQKSGFRLVWHGIDVPTISLGDNPPLDMNDVLVIPEGMWSILKQLTTIDITKIMFVLNWHPSYWQLPAGEKWSDYGVTGVLTPSQVIADYVQWRSNLPVTMISSYINPKLYHYDARLKKPLIAYTSRKCQDADIIRDILPEKSDRFEQFNWQVMNNLSESEYAQTLQQATFYLTPSPQEGLNISVLEAMACGCIVIGYHGIGGREFMVGEPDQGQQNCFTIENGNLPQFGQVLEQVLINWLDNPQQYEPIIQNALKTARNYQDQQKQKQELANFFEQFIDQKNLRQSTPTLGAKSPAKGVDAPLSVTKSRGFSDKKLPQSKQIKTPLNFSTQIKIMKSKQATRKPHLICVKNVKFFQIFTLSWQQIFLKISSFDKPP